MCVCVVAQDTPISCESWFALFLPDEETAHPRPADAHKKSLVRAGSQTASGPGGLLRGIPEKYHNNRDTEPNPKRVAGKFKRQPWLATVAAMQAQVNTKTTKTIAPRIRKQREEGEGDEAPRGSQRRRFEGHLSGRGLAAHRLTKLRLRRQAGGSGPNPPARKPAGSWGFPFQG